MSSIRKPDPKLAGGVVLALLALLVPAALVAQNECAEATAVTLNATYRSSGTEMLKATLSSAGALTLDISTPAAAAQPKITFLGTGCPTASGEGSAFDYVQDDPAWVVADVHSSSTYYFKVEPEDSQQSLGSFKVRVAWVADLTTPDEENELTSDATDTCSTSSTAIFSGSLSDSTFGTVIQYIEEYDPDIMRGHINVPGIVTVAPDDPNGPDLDATLYSSVDCDGSSQLDGAVFSGSSGRIAAAMHPGDLYLDLGSHSASSGTFTVAVKLLAPCDLGETDDVGDSALCATDVDVDDSTSGEISNDDDDDLDFFSFVVSSTGGIAVQTTGSTDTYCSLYDEDGQRLEIDDDDGSGDNCYIERSLGAGRYFIRVEGDGEEGSYGLSVSSSS